MLPIMILNPLNEASHNRPRQAIGAAGKALVAAYRCFRLSLCMALLTRETTSARHERVQEESLNFSLHIFIFPTGCSRIVFPLSPWP